MLFLDEFNKQKKQNIMIQRFLLLISVFICLSISLQGQTDKNTWILGGTGFVGSLDKGLYLNLQPNAGYFLYDNFAVGGQMKLTVTTDINQTSNTQFTLGPYARYYIGKGKVKALGEIVVGLNAQDKTILTFQAGAGAAWFVRDNVSLDFLAVYGINDNTNGLVGDRFGVNVGFQVYFFR